MTPKIYEPGAYGGMRECESASLTDDFRYVRAQDYDSLQKCFLSAMKMLELRPSRIEEYEQDIDGKFSEVVK